MSDIQIRVATAQDLPTINDIYNHYVLNSTCTYQEQPESPEGRAAWFARHGPDHPVTIATLDDAIVGWGALSPFHVRTAYRNTVENTVYVSPTHLRRGIGTMLLNDLVDRARELNHHTILAIIDADQHPSLALHAAAGFEQVAFLKQVGYKFDRWLNVIYMQLLL
jgi:L-amino acid N-acyltransferase YncA